MAHQHADMVCAQGPSQLTIELRDGEFMANKETKHEAIGSTTIDLEDRWFCQDWKDEKYKPREVCVCVVCVWEVCVCVGIPVRAGV